MRRLLFVLALVCATAAPALAQDDKPYDIFLGGGAIFPVGAVHDDFNTGGRFAIGGTYYFTPNLGFQAEYNYNKMSGPDKTIGLSVNPQAVANGTALIQSNQQIHAGVFDLVVRSTHHDSGMGAYFLGGGGIYHRMVQLTSPAIGYVTVCDPYWYVCYPTATSVDQILGDRSSNDFGINFGAGVTFGHEAKFYVEARYTYVFGKDITSVNPLASGTKTSTSAGYFPLMFGVRF